MWYATFILSTHKIDLKKPLRGSQNLKNLACFVLRNLLGHYLITDLAPKFTKNNIYTRKRMKKKISHFGKEDCMCASYENQVLPIASSSSFKKSYPISFF